MTVGPPFLERGRTEFRASATKSAVLGATFGVADYLKAGARFDWPDAPGIDGTPVDLRRYVDRMSSSAYTAHLMDGALDHAKWHDYRKIFATHVVED